MSFFLCIFFFIQGTLKTPVQFKVNFKQKSTFGKMTSTDFPTLDETCASQGISTTHFNGLVDFLRLF